MTEANVGMSHQYPEPPEPPPEAEWPFEEELTKPLHVAMPFGDGPAPAEDELDFRGGIALTRRFPDPDCRLDTAYADFGEFSASIALGNGPTPVVTELASGYTKEEYRISVGTGGITVAAGETEGIRRGLIHLEEMILARRNWCLPYGATRRKPSIRTRLSRCFHGPINRPPKCRDELLDENDYYADGYLNRLAHHGINGLWMTIRFSDLIASKVLPELGSGSPRRLEKLRRNVRQCARYGIKLYPFCIEPAALSAESPVLKAHPGLKGSDAMGNRALFCTSSAIGQAYLEDATRTLFSEVPGLGGLICIPVGERFTHCYSGRLAINCPRCSSREPWEVLADTLAAMERGMHGVDPEAELIAWPYSQLVVWGAQATETAAGHMPAKVILQHNFETGGKVKQLGKWRPLWDYWLSWVGPSRNFKVCATAARRNGTRMFAKLQTSCSHEVATTQYVPVPGILYRKYKRMRALGVSGVMQGWYFGNYPGIMTRASRVLSFSPFPRTEREFLLALAAPAWGSHAPRMVEAWEHFADGYSHYPGAQVFGYYGPMHDGVVWPLYLGPRHLPLAPTWRIVHPMSGDQVGECISAHFEYREVLALCKLLRDHWRKGTAIIRQLEGSFSAECRQEINVALALGVQFDSAYNILLFYQLRDQLADAGSRQAQLALLEKLRGLVLAEIENDRVLLELCAENRTLGFHSEAEGYKYFPEKIRWRMGQLQSLLEVEFPKVASQVGRYPMPSFENYVGKGDSIQAYPCRRVSDGDQLGRTPFDPEWDGHATTVCRFWAAPRASEAAQPFPFNSTLYPVAEPKNAPPPLAWRAVWDERAVHVCLIWQAEAGPVVPGPDDDEIRITLEPDRLGVGRSIVIRKSQPELAAFWAEKPTIFFESRGAEARLTLTVPFDQLGLPPSSGRRLPMRINVSCFFTPITDPLCFTGEPLLNSWAPSRRTMPRNLFGYTDPGTYGWLQFNVNSTEEDGAQP